MVRWKCETCVSGDAEDALQGIDQDPCIFHHPEVIPEDCILLFKDTKGHAKAKWERI
ncbi:hypothetical protein KAR91_06835 [Candidatus Pacearchaeota archaeon]|nr:hypothetical protein [Candidatus Pacearchaeota archaeon]